ncbi:MAG: hypothetical protein M1830_004433 [Pleopsidium flavum]|nr:MAG: hypothetical protein M1830_004433 [Pleopsidium flavum]
MSIVVGQTVPFSQQLDLDNPERWSKLFPLIRPSVTRARAAKGQAIIVDRSLAGSQNVQIAAVGRTGSFSSKLLSERSIAAFATEQHAKSAIGAKDIAEALRANKIACACGLVVVKASNKRNLEVIEDGLVEVDVNGGSELDHVLSLFSVANRETRASLSQTTELLKIFLKTATNTTSTFDLEKTGANPSVIHAGSSASFVSAKAAVQKDLVHVLRSHTAQEGPVVYSIHYSDINGLARLENYLLAHEISIYIDEQNLQAHITSSTILDSANGARGWSISICPIPQSFLAAQSKPPNSLTEKDSKQIASMKPRNSKPTTQFTDAEVRQRITLGCEAVIKAEPEITEYDTIVGDGDCGFTLRDGAKQVLSFIANQDLSNLPQSLSELVDDLEVNMGGTSGALYCIFLSSLAQNLWDAKIFPDALAAAQDHLLKYTRARLGDRTCLDCLIPFVDTLKASGDAQEAFQKARGGVEGTKQLEAKLGRSAYLDESATKGVPDPGAYGLLKLLEGMTVV